jgi:hypothetical protein
MKSGFSATVLLLGGMFAAVQSTSAVAQGSSLTPWDPESSELKNPQIEIAYVEPRNSNYRPIYDRLKKRQVLEELRAFLAPLRLPRKLRVKIQECGEDPQQPVTICYEYLDRLERLAPEGTVLFGVGKQDRREDEVITREDVLVGAFVQATLRETALAVFDLLDVPFWGRAEFAADNVAALIMLQFGKAVAWKTVIGSAWILAQLGATGIGDFYVPRSAEAQRFFNYICLAWAADPELFAFLVRNKNLPQERADDCASDYVKLRYSFDATITPHVDQELLKKVQSIEWLKVTRGARE